jgi:hypothetical protein
MRVRFRPLRLGSDGRVAPAEFIWVSRLWAARGAIPPARERLPSCATAAYFEHAPGTPIAVVFSYLDACSSGVAWLAWLATDPAAPPVTRARALIGAIRHHLAVIKTFDYWLVSATYSEPSLGRLLRRLGFRREDGHILTLSLHHSHHN